ncbi:MAG: glutathione S-transferase family protein [Planctomycetes bacterium]|nr:glutathione S-transferase family protein [Planctomycetota bacterium]
MRVYGDRKSGNCYKVQLVCSLLGQAMDWVDVDLLAGETRTSEFLQMNPNGKIPVVVLGDGEILTESNAIINYLASNTPLYPSDPLLAARVQQWQFFEQYSHEPFIAVARFINKYLGLPEDRRGEYEAKQEGGNRALAVIEQQLQRAPFLAGKTLTTADVSLYAYTHVADEGGFDLTQFPAIQGWLKRVELAPGYVPVEC